MLAAEPDSHEALLAMGYGTGIVPRLVLECSASADRLVEAPVDPKRRPSPSGPVSAAETCVVP